MELTLDGRTHDSTYEHLVDGLDAIGDSSVGAYAGGRHEHSEARVRPSEVSWSEAAHRHEEPALSESARLAATWRSTFLQSSSSSESELGSSPPSPVNVQAASAAAVDRRGQRRGHDEGQGPPQGAPRPASAGPGAERSGPDSAGRDQAQTEVPTEAHTEAQMMSQAAQAAAQAASLREADLHALRNPLTLRRAKLQHVRPAPAARHYSRCYAWPWPLLSCRVWEIFPCRACLLSGRRWY